MKTVKRLTGLFLILCLLAGLMPPSMAGAWRTRAQAGNVDWDSLFSASGWSNDSTTGETEDILDTIDEDETYTSKEEVAAYLYLFGHLPDNYITKNEAKKLGWENSKGNLDEVAPGKSIGGDRFGNYEGNLPEKKKRTYYECDIDYKGGYRGPKRIIYSNDGLLYYTEDHYKTFELLYE